MCFIGIIKAKKLRKNNKSHYISAGGRKYILKGFSQSNVCNVLLCNDIDLTTFKKLSNLACPKSLLEACEFTSAYTLLHQGNGVRLSAA